jgi:hypothetical protein
MSLPPHLYPSDLSDAEWVPLIFSRRADKTGGGPSRAMVAEGEVVAAVPEDGLPSHHGHKRAAPHRAPTIVEGQRAD